MSTRSEYQKHMAENLGSWRRRLDALGSKTRTEALNKMGPALEEWKQAGNRAASKLEELRSSTGNAWEPIRTEMENLWHELDASLASGETHRLTGEDAPAPATKPTLTLVRSIPDSASDSPKSA